MIKDCFSFDILSVALLGIFKYSELANQNDHSITMNIVQRIPHPDFVIGQFHNNIGLLKLERLIEFNPGVRPACLPTHSDFFDSAIAVGWAYFNNTSSILRASTLTMPSLDKCKETHKKVKELKNAIASGTQICVKINRNLCLVSNTSSTNKLALAPNITYNNFFLVPECGSELQRSFSRNI